MVALFYKTLEDKFRGSRDLIKSRLQIYKAFIEPIKAIYPKAQILDLGCGRGEWLEYVTELGFLAEGVDLDENMLEEGKKLGFNVHIDNAISFLKKLPNESYAVISAFHFVEHITFDDLQTLVEQSLRVLQPGGLLLMETPNPENIIVGTLEFYIDPTHEKPIPPNLLAFLPEYYGFLKTKILRLQEAKNLAHSQNISLTDVLCNVSPDYAVIAQKKHLLEKSNDILSILQINEAFEIEYGITLTQLMMKYDEQNLTRQKCLELDLAELKEQIDNLKNKCGANHELESIYKSFSWKITRPLRKIKSLCRHLLFLIDELTLNKKKHRLSPSKTKSNIEPSKNYISFRTMKIYDAIHKAQIKRRN